MTETSIGQRLREVRVSNLLFRSFRSLLYLGNQD